MRLSENQKARIRAIEAPAEAEGRELTAPENRAVFDVVMSCIGRDVTDRVRILRRPGEPDMLLLDGQVVGPYERPQRG